MPRAEFGFAHVSPLKNETETHRRARLRLKKKRRRPRGMSSPHLIYRCRRRCGPTVPPTNLTASRILQSRARHPLGAFPLLDSEASAPVVRGKRRHGGNEGGSVRAVVGGVVRRRRPEHLLPLMGENLLFYGDNLDVLRRHIKDESVDLVYLDPPFKSDQNYNVLFEEKDGSRSAAQIKVFEDTWQWDQAAAAAYEEVVVAGGAVSRVMEAFRTFRPHLLPLRSALIEWADPHGLRETERDRDPWALNAAVRTLRTWAASVLVELRWSFPPTSVRPPFTDAEEQVLEKERSAHRRRHEARREIALARERGFRPARRKRDTIHYLWLAEFQLLGWTYERISRTQGSLADRTTVSEAVKRTAACIGLELRAPKPGRPRGKTV